MNRHEALAALVALPATTRISVAALQPSDVIVIECDEHLSLETVERIKTTAQGVWPGRKAVVLAKGMRLKIAAGGSV